MHTKTEHHPLTAHPETIDERGLMVFDDIRSMPNYDEPFTTRYMVISLNVSGWVHAECDMKPIIFRPHDIAVLPPHHILYARESSDNYQAMLIVMSEAFQQEMKHHYVNIYRDNFHYLLAPSISLNEEQFTIVCQLYGMLKTVSEKNSPHRIEMLGSLLNVLFIHLQDFRHENGIPDHQPSSHEMLFNNFYQSITQHYRESREVNYYADLFHLSSKHFATVIKQHTGINALQWISSYVVIQAKKMLRYHQQMTIQEISSWLGFLDQASFSRYFKTNAGMSPKEYREKY